MKPVIEFENFTFRYKSQTKPTLNNINLTIFEGEKVLILGPSGSGKSTLASCINGIIPFLEPGEINGTCKVNGINTSEQNINKLSKYVGTVLQDSDAQFVGLSVAEDIAFAMENDYVPRKDMVVKVMDSARIVGMEDFLDHLPYTLSGGQKQKVALAGVMHEDVNLLIFDEPLAALDPQMGMTAVDLIDQICRERNKTAVIIEHRLEDILYRSVDRIILMVKGEIAANLTANELLRSDLLHMNGIREPLYLTAMKYANCNLQDQDNLDTIETLNLTSFNKSKLLEFFHKEIETEKIEERESIAEVNDVTFAYDAISVLKNVSFRINQGERIAFVGKNGAGKTTMARLLCGFHRPTSGKIQFDGKDYLSLSIKEIGEHIGYVMQNPNQMLVKDTIKKEVEMALRIRSFTEAEITEKTEKALKMCDLYSMRNWPVSSVSYGQRKRITIAAILALEPEILIMDEPTAGQDYKHYTEIMEFIANLNREFGKTIIMITHDMHLAIEYTDRAIVFADGELIADDKVFKVLSDDEVIKKANLKQTSLYLLACKIGVSPEDFISHFIDYERTVKINGQ